MQINSGGVPEFLFTVSSAANWPFQAETPSPNALAKGDANLWAVGLSWDGSNPRNGIRKVHQGLSDPAALNLFWAQPHSMLPHFPARWKWSVRWRRILFVPSGPTAVVEPHQLISGTCRHSDNREAQRASRVYLCSNLPVSPVVLSCSNILQVLWLNAQTILSHRGGKLTSWCQQFVSCLLKNNLHFVSRRLCQIGDGRGFSELYTPWQLRVLDSWSLQSETGIVRGDTEGFLLWSLFGLQTGRRILLFKDGDGKLRDAQDTLVLLLTHRVTIGTLNTTFEIENVNLNVKFFFACLEFSPFWESFWLVKILLNKIDQKTGFAILNFSV